MKSKIRLQPLFNLGDMSNFGYEALCQKPNGRGSYPSAIRILGTILAECNSNVRLFINLTLQDLRNKKFYDRFVSLTKHYNIDCGNIVFEVSEDTPPDVFDDAIPMLIALQNCGAKVALDDFGLSYSLVNFSKDFYFDFVKIDQAFVQQSSDHVVGVMKHLIDVAKESGCTVIAEGIETYSQLSFSLTNGATIGQGFILAAKKNESSFIQLTEFGNYIKEYIAA